MDGIDYAWENGEDQDIGQRWISLDKAVSRMRELRDTGFGEAYETVLELCESADTAAEKLWRVNSTTNPETTYELTDRVEETLNELNDIVLYLWRRAQNLLEGHGAR